MVMLENVKQVRESWEFIGPVVVLRCYSGLDLLCEARVNNPAPALFPYWGA